MTFRAPPGVPSPAIVLFSAAGSLRFLETAARRRGWRLVRIRSIESRPVPPARWLPRVRRWGLPDMVVATSRAGVEAGVRPWAAAVRAPRGRIAAWAVGPATARALRAAGFRPVRSPPRVGAAALARSLGRRPPGRLLYFRSDRAGPGLGRALRRGGHTVLDPVVYRVAGGGRLAPAERREIGAARLLIVTSPSGFDELDRRLDPRSRRRLARSVRTVVLGRRSARRARAAGFRRLSVAPSTAAQRFTRHLLDELDDGARTGPRPPRGSDPTAAAPPHRGAPGVGRGDGRRTPPARLPDLRPARRRRRRARAVDAGDRAAPRLRAAGARGGARG